MLSTHAGQKTNAHNEGLLMWYNNKGVQSLLRAVYKMVSYYKAQLLDMFKNAISVPGLTLKYMFRDLPVYFTVPDKFY